MRAIHGIGVALLAVAAAACVAGTKQVAVRPIGLPARGSDTVAGDVAEARGQLALGNVGLAIEQYRKALRQQPQSVDSLVGIARCYDAMGRTDLSRRYFEEALAIAPGNVETLDALADSLVRQGRADEARQVRAEILLRSRAAGSTVQWTIDDHAAAAPAGGSATTVTVDLPPAELASAQPRRVAEVLSRAQVRLERLSLGEVALVTTARPLWSTPMSKLSRDGRPQQLRLLNAARLQGLAARTREQLADAGWRSIAIGDAPHTRARSIIYYPAARRHDAARIATNLRIDALQATARTDILVLLGRDSG